MKKQIGIVIATMMAITGGAHAAKVCVSDSKFEEMVRSVIPKNYFCSNSTTERTGEENRMSGACWCRVYGSSWTYTGAHSDNCGNGQCQSICAGEY
jgi:hypothetical protein